MANVLNMGGGGANVESKTVKSAKTTQTITPGDGVDGFNPVTVQPIKLASVTVPALGEAKTIVPPTGYDGIEEVVVVESYRVDRKDGWTEDYDSSSFALIMDTNFGELRALFVHGRSLRANSVISAAWTNDIGDNRNSVIYIDGSNTPQVANELIEVSTETVDLSRVVTININKSGVVFAGDTDYIILVVYTE